MQRQNNKKRLLHNSDGFAVVEATFVFPIMFMVFFALVMLAFYLPQRAMLQRATQYAATAIATELSDTWVYFDEESLSYQRFANYDELGYGANKKGNVYSVFFNSLLGKDNPGNADGIVNKLDEKENPQIITAGTLSKDKQLTVEAQLVSYVVYKEVIVTATRTIKLPLDLNFAAIKFPDEIELVVTSKAVVVNGDEFIRNIDLAVDFVWWVDKKLNLNLAGIFEKITEAGTKVSGFFGV